MALPFIILIASSAGLIYILSRPPETRGQIVLAFGPFLAAGIAVTFLALNFIM
jgi:prepilin signal peptidase PulO-like enzyme (type II secretory pathway)